MNQAAAAVATENAALDDIAIVYLGASLEGHRYGVQMNDALKYHGQSGSMTEGSFVLSYRVDNGKRRCLLLFRLTTSAGCPA